MTLPLPATCRHCGTTREAGHYGAGLSFACKSDTSHYFEAGPTYGQLEGEVDALREAGRERDGTIEGQRAVIQSLREYLVAAQENYAAADAERQNAIKLVQRLTEAAGCPDEESFIRIEQRIRNQHAAILGTHRIVTPAEGGPDECGDCGVDIEDACEEATLCSAHGKRDMANVLLDRDERIALLEGKLATIRELNQRAIAQAESVVANRTELRALVRWLRRFISETHGELIDPRGEELDAIDEQIATVLGDTTRQADGGGK